MLKAFFRDSAIYGSAKLLTGSIALLTLPIYTRMLGPADYGAVDLLTSVAAIVHVVAALEISQGFGRYVLSPDGLGHSERYASTAFWFTLGAYSCLVLVVFPFSDRLSQWLFGSDGYTTVLQVATLVIWSTGLFNMAQNILRYERRTIPYAIASVVFASLSVGVTLFLLLIVNAGLVGVFIGQFCAGVASTAIALWFARDRLSTSFDGQRWRQMLLFSLPLVPSSLGVMLTTYVDRYAIVRLMTLDDLGYYSVAFRLASVVAVALAGFLSAVAPLVYQHHARPGAPAELARTFQWFLAVAVPLVLFLGLFSGEIVQLVSSAQYRQASGLVFALGASMMLASCYTFSPGLWIANRTGWVAAIGFATGLTNLTLNFTLIPLMGLAGAAVSTGLSAALGAICHFVWGGRFYHVPFHYRRIGIAVTIAAGASLFVAAPWSGEPSLTARALGWLSISVAIGVILVGRRDLGLARDHLRAALGRPRVPRVTR